MGAEGCRSHRTRAKSRRSRRTRAVGDQPCCLPSSELLGWVQQLRILETKQCADNSKFYVVDEMVIGNGKLRASVT